MFSFVGFSVNSFSYFLFGFFQSPNSIRLYFQLTEGEWMLNVYFPYGICRMLLNGACIFSSMSLCVHFNILYELACRWSTPCFVMLTRTLNLGEYVYGLLVCGSTWMHGRIMSFFDCSLSWFMRRCGFFFVLLCYLDYFV